MIMAVMEIHGKWGHVMKMIAPFGPIGPIGLHVQELVVVEKKLKLENVSFLIV